MHWPALIVFILLFGFITVLGFFAACWRAGDPIATARRHLDQPDNSRSHRRALHALVQPWALLIGWAAGIVVGTGMAAAQHFQSAVFPLTLDGFAAPG